MHATQPNMDSRYSVAAVPLSLYFLGCALLDWCVVDQHRMTSMNTQSTGGLSDIFFFFLQVTEFITDAITGLPTHNQVHVR